MKKALLTPTMDDGGDVPLMQRRIVDQLRKELFIVADQLRSCRAENAELRRLHQEDVAVNERLSQLPYRYVPPHAFLPDVFVREYFDVLELVDKYAQLYHKHHAVAPTGSPAVDLGSDFLSSRSFFLEEENRRLKQQLAEKESSVAELQERIATLADALARSSAAPKMPTEVQKDLRAVSEPPQPPSIKESPSAKPSAPRRSGAAHQPADGEGTRARELRANSPTRSRRQQPLQSAIVPPGHRHETVPWRSLGISSSPYHADIDDDAMPPRLTVLSDEIESTKSGSVMQQPADKRVASRSPRGLQSAPADADRLRNDLEAL